MMKKVLNVIENGINNICLIFSKGFFFYFVLLAKLLHKIFPLNIFKKLILFFKKCQEDAAAFLFVVVLFLLGITLYIHFYNDSQIKYVSDDFVETKSVKLDKTELNLYKRYSKLEMSPEAFKKIKKDKSNVVVWITVDGTNINYPVVKADDNSYYLNHDINKNLKASGWIFMDYRNAMDLSDDNTVIYGHNLANKTAFGSLSNLFTKKWYKESNHYIELINEDGKYKYEIFSIYTVEPEVYYLQSNFKNKEEYLEFIKALKLRSVYDFDVELEKDDNILTLSTCTDDNKSRRVVHARLIKE